MDGRLCEACPPVNGGGQGWLPWETGSPWVRMGWDGALSLSCMSFCFVVLCVCSLQLGPAAAQAEKARLAAAQAAHMAHSPKCRNYKLLVDELPPAHKYGS